MTETTWPDPARPGVPLNPEKDGWHWLEDSVDGVGTGHIEAVYYVAWSVPIWYRAGNRSAIAKPKQWRYLGPVLTPDETAALQKRIAELETALRFYADDENWRRDSELDPSSGKFTGGPARAVIKKDRQP